MKALAEAEAEGETVISATLAHWLAVSRPAVTAALKRLKKDGMVTVKNDGRIQLTSQGRRIAEQTIFRHHLIERMLSEIFGMPWYEIHEEAERLEHAVSPAVRKEAYGEAGQQGHLSSWQQPRLAESGGTAEARPALAQRSRCGLSHTGSPECTNGTASCWTSLKAKESVPGSHWPSRARNYDGTLSLAVGKRTTSAGRSRRRENLGCEIIISATY